MKKRAHGEGFLEKIMKKREKEGIEKKKKEKEMKEE